MNYLQLRFHDEAPNFGSGVRRVLVVSEGPRWIKLLDPADCAVETLAARDPLVGYDAVAHKATVVDFDPEKMVDRLLKNAKIYDRFSPTVRDALLELGADPSRLPRHVEAAAPRPMPVAGDEPDTPHEGEGSGKFIQRLWMTGKYDPDQLVALVLASYPGRKTKRTDVYFNYNLLLKAGVENVPPWPSKK